MVNLPRVASMVQYAAGGPAHGIPQEIHTPGGVDRLWFDRVGGRTAVRSVAAPGSMLIRHWIDGVVGRGGDASGGFTRLWMGDQRPAWYRDELAFQARQFRARGGLVIDYLGTFQSWESVTPAQAMAESRAILEHVQTVADGVIFDAGGAESLGRCSRWVRDYAIGLLEELGAMGKVRGVEPVPHRSLEWVASRCDLVFADYVTQIARSVKLPAIVQQMIPVRDLGAEVFVWVNIPPGRRVVDPVAGSIDRPAAFGDDDPLAIANTIVLSGVPNAGEAWESVRRVIVSDGLEADRAAELVKLGREG